MIEYITDITFILLSFGIFVLSYISLDKKMMQPSVLFSLIWCVILLSHFICRHTITSALFNISDYTRIILLFGMFVFWLSAFITHLSLNLPQKQKPIKEQLTHFINFKIRLFALIVVIIGLPVYINSSLELFIKSNAENLLIGLRQEISYGDSNIGPSIYFFPLSYVVFAYNVLEYHIKKSKANSIVLALSAITLLGYCIFATGRTYFFLIFSIYLGLTYFNNHRLSLKKIALSFLLFVIIFLGLGIIYEKGGSTNQSFSENIKSSSEHFGVYLVTSLNALDIELQTKNTEFQNGNNTLRFFIKAGQKIGLFKDKKITDLIQEYQFVPYATNVYTFYSPYIRDMGLIYAFFILSMIAIVHTWLYKIAQTVPKARLYYSFLLFPLLLTFFADQYLSLFSFWLQIFLLTELIYFINKLFKHD